MRLNYLLMLGVVAFVFVNAQAAEFQSNGKQHKLTVVEGAYFVGLPSTVSLGPNGSVQYALEAVSGVQSVNMLGEQYAVVNTDPQSSRAKASLGLPGVQTMLKATSGVRFAYPVYRYASNGYLVYPKPEVIVKLQAGVNVFQLAQSYGLSVVRPLLYTDDEFILRLSSNDDPFVISDALNDDENVIWSNPNFIQQRKLRFTPNDPLYGDQWHLSNTGQGDGVPGADVNAEAAWDLHTPRADVVLAVVDDAIDISHPDLNIYVNQIEANGTPGVDDDNNGLVDDINGWDFGSGDNDPSPPTADDAHGTSVAGVAAAIGNNGLGVVGAAYGVSVLPVRIDLGGNDTFPDAEAEEASFADAIRYAAKYGDVMNNSWGGPVLSDAVSSALDFATSDESKRGALKIPVLFASGNSATSFLTFESDEVVSAGQHTIRFVYEKDSSGSGGQDKVWIERASVYDVDSGEELEDAYIDTPFDEEFPFDVTGDGDVPFVIVESDLTESGYVFQSGAIGDNQTSGMTWEVNLPSEGILTFNFRASTEEFADVLYVLLDGEELFGSAYVADTQNPGGGGEDFFDFPFSGEVAENLFPIAGENLHPNVINIGASNNFDVRSTYSQWGPQIHFVAPSDGGSLGIITTDVTGSGMGYDPDSDYTLAEGAAFGGTSSACPLAAGVIAMVISANPDLSSDEIVSVLRQTSVKIGNLPYDANGFNQQYGYGRLDMAAAVQLALDMKPVSVDAWALY
ncbi:MAG: S8 family serine peptidase [Candidatus Hinthialibacter antarcticus]|nr:S8 family serine peptidase [Candidatus Hinthialibacter antarcticus]